MAPDPTGRRCPDCGVTLETMTLRSNGGYELQLVSDENREGLLGSLGVKEKHGVEAGVCPECARTLLYADLDG
jgi:ssDNA-binding Zn-finger/Zn-ribbon topoisomerase 1